MIRGHATVLKGKTVGVIGDGAIGTAVARLASGFGMSPVMFGLHANVTAESVVSNSDFVTLHVLPTDSTRSMFSLGMLEKMQPTAFLVKCARWPVVNSGDVKAILDRGGIAGAALDVFDVERPLPSALKPPSG